MKYRTVSQCWDKRLHQSVDVIAKKKKKRKWISHVNVNPLLLKETYTGQQAEGIKSRNVLNNYWTEILSTIPAKCAETTISKPFIHWCTEAQFTQYVY